MVLINSPFRSHPASSGPVEGSGDYIISARVAKPRLDSDQNIGSLDRP